MLFLRQLILFRPKIFLGYQCLSRCTRFLVLSHKDVQDFFDFHLKLNFFFYYPSFSKILEPLPLGSLRQWLNWPSGRVALHGLSKFVRLMEAITYLLQYLTEEVPIIHNKSCVLWAIVLCFRMEKKKKKLASISSLTTNNLRLINNDNPSLKAHNSTTTIFTRMSWENRNPYNIIHEPQWSQNTPPPLGTPGLPIRSHQYLV